MVSVVVPVYNVEPYLKQCLESICRQDYKNLEILIVDDGSTDGSSLICDEFAKVDERIRVIHQKNMGLSEARNTGMKYAGGEFLYFVDSDDWLEVEAIGNLMETQQARGADVVCGSYCISDGLMRRDCVCKSREYAGDEGLFELCRDREIKNYAWGKLYRRVLFDGVEYPSGKLFEDIYTTYRVFLKSKKIATDSYCGYDYRVRQEGISKQRDIRTAIARCEAQIERYWKLENEDPIIRDILQKQVLSAYMALIMAYWSAGRTERKKYQEELTKCCSFWDERVSTEGNMQLSFIEKREIRCLKHRKKGMFRQLLFLNVVRKIQEILGGKSK